METVALNRYFADHMKNLHTIICSVTWSLLSNVRSNMYCITALCGTGGGLTELIWWSFLSHLRCYWHKSRFHLKLLAFDNVTDWLMQLFFAKTMRNKQLILLNTRLPILNPKGLVRVLYYSQNGVHGIIGKFVNPFCLQSIVHKSLKWFTPTNLTLYLCFLTTYATYFSSSIGSI